jgi:hypothetical protein
VGSGDDTLLDAALPREDDRDRHDRGRCDWAADPGRPQLRLKAEGYGGWLAYGASRLLASSTSNWIGWACFGIGFFLVPVVLADWPEPLILDGQGLLESGCASTRIRWQELKHVRQYRIRCDRGVVIHGADGKELVVADIAYDSEAVLDCLLRWRAVPFYSLQDEMRPISILSDHYSQ